MIAVLLPGGRRLCITCAWGRASRLHARLKLDSFEVAYVTDNGERCIDCGRAAAPLAGGTCDERR